MQLTGNDVLDRALASLLQIGTVTAVREKPLAYKVKFSETRTSGWMLPGVSRAGDSVSQDSLSAGEQVLCALPFGSEKGVIICAIYCGNAPQPLDSLKGFYRKFADGATIKYDSETSNLTAILPEGATALIKAPVSVTLDTELVHCTKDLTVDRDITAGRNVSDVTRSMAGDRGIYDDHDHSHGDPVTGKANQKQGGS